MAVVINEFEVAPAAAPKAPAGSTRTQDSTAATPQLLRNIERAARAREWRECRLKAD